MNNKMTKDYQMNEEFLRTFFKIGDKNEIIITIAKGSSYTICTLEELLNPKYALFEIVKIILSKIIESSSCPSIASENSCNYNNILMILAAITERVDDDTMEMWKTRLFSKRSIL